MYINCHTWMSFKYGTLSPDALFDEAKKHGVGKLIVTEINNTASYIELLRVIEDRKDEFELSIALGMEFRNSLDNDCCFIAIAKNNEGFAKINKYRSYLNEKKFMVPVRAPFFDEDVIVVYPWSDLINIDALRPFEYIGIRRQQLNKLTFHRPYHEYKDKYVVLHPVTFADKQGYNIHRLLRAVHFNTLLSKLLSNQHAGMDEKMLPEADLEKAFERFPNIVANTKALVAACSIDFTMGVDKNKKLFTDSAEADWETLVTLTWEGFQRRYDPSDESLRERLNRELDTIKAMNFCTYFLVAYDVIRFADEKGYHHIGRGSGANSMVAYCLQITDVDPVELDLYFERFLNVERTTPPDFDLDFSWENRDAIYEYFFERYGKDHVALLGTHVTFGRRSVIRELGKVFGLPKQEIDQLVDYPADRSPGDQVKATILRYAARLEGMPSHISIHAGGVLVTELPMYAYTALEYPPKDLPVTNFEMRQAEDFGIHKFDILSQRGLGHIKETARLVKLNRGIDVDVKRFAEFKRDEKIRALLRNAKTIGCFYVESPAMRMLLGKLRCEDYLTLVAASSIIRPGVSSSGMMQTYIERFHKVRNGETYESIHPKMDELLRETYGVMVYQEDVIKVAHHFAGLSLTEADVLRRAMSGKYRSRKAFEAIQQKFFDNCRSYGYPELVIDRVWFEIQSFGGYSFAKGHSASFALESYQSLYLKAHYPLEFMVAVINNFGGFYRAESYFHEARMSGAIIEAPCVNNSHYLTSIVGDTIWIGFIHLKGIQEDLGKRIAVERAANGPYKNLPNFLKRNQVKLEQARILIRIGALRFTGKTKQELLWEVMARIEDGDTKTGETELFIDEEPITFDFPVLKRTEVDDAYDEIELLGFPLGDAFNLVAGGERGEVVAQDLPKRVGDYVSIVGYFVTAKDTSTVRDELMTFATFFDSHGEVFDTVHFPKVAKEYPIIGRGFYYLKGKVTEEFGVVNLQVSYLLKMPLKKKK